MSDFDTRPMGTVMYGAFNAFAPAERALRVLKNAGYARASFESGDAEERASDEPAVVVVDAAAAGATRAAEILEEHGAQIRFAPTLAAPVSIHVQPALEVAAPLFERKPRERKRARPERPNVPVPAEPLAWDNVIIVTRPIESVASD